MPWLLIRLSGAGLRGQQLQQGTPDFPFPFTLTSSDGGIPRCSQASFEIISPQSPGSSLRSPPHWLFLERLTLTQGRRPVGIPTTYPKHLN